MAQPLPSDNADQLPVGGRGEGGVFKVFRKQVRLEGMDQSLAKYRGFALHPNELSLPKSEVYSAYTWHGRNHEIHDISPKISRFFSARNFGQRSNCQTLLEVISQQRVVIPNNSGEKLVGVLHETGSREVVILCHGFRSSKEDKTILNLITAITREGFSAFHFDFAGNGESEGVFQYGNYRKEADDLRAVVVYLSQKKYETSAILGHSKGGNVVLLYASTHHDIHTVINVSGRFALERGIEGRLGKEFIERIKRDGFIDVKDRTGKFEFRVTEESLMDRLNTDMHAACLSIDNNCRVLTVHGSADEIIPSEDALEIAKLIPNHKLRIIEGADHCYTAHQEELASVVVDFLRSKQVGDVTAVGDI